MQTGTDLDILEVIEMPQPLWSYSHDLFKRAAQYLRATEILAESQGEPPYTLPYPMYFALSHSLELYLKFYLVHRGMPKKETRAAGIRHSPNELFKLCKAEGLPHVDFLEMMAMQIEEMNSSYDFRYPTGYNLSLPTMPLCLPVLQDLQGLLLPIIEQARAEGQLQWASETRPLQGKKIRWSD